MLLTTIYLEYDGVFLMDTSSVLDMDMDMDMSTGAGRTKQHHSQHKYNSISYRNRSSNSNSNKDTLLAPAAILYLPARLPAVRARGDKPLSLRAPSDPSRLERHLDRIRPQLGQSMHMEALCPSSPG